MLAQSYVPRLASNVFSIQTAVPWTVPLHTFRMGLSAQCCPTHLSILSEIASMGTLKARVLYRSQASLVPVRLTKARLASMGKLGLSSEKGADGKAFRET